MDLRAESDSDADAFGADSDATSQTDLRGTFLVRLLERTGTGVQLDGNTAVWLHAVVVGVRLVADSDASCDCFAGDATARSNADWISVAKVAGQDESFIRTTDLTVETGQDWLAYARPNNAHGGAFVSHNEPEGGTAAPPRLIYWESTVIMLGEPNPVLVVDADGTIVEKVNVVVSGVRRRSTSSTNRSPRAARSPSATSSTTAAASPGSARTRSSSTRQRRSGATPGCSTTRRRGTTSGSSTPPTAS